MVLFFALMKMNGYRPNFRHFGLKRVLAVGSLILEVLACNAFLIWLKRSVNGLSQNCHNKGSVRD